MRPYLLIGFSITAITLGYVIPQYVDKKDFFSGDKISAYVQLNMVNKCQVIITYDDKSLTTNLGNCDNE